jgi:hypothetical protein
MGEFIDGFGDCAGVHPPTDNTTVSLHQYLTYSKVTDPYSNATTTVEKKFSAHELNNDGQLSMLEAMTPYDYNRQLCLLVLQRASPALASGR